LVLRAHQAQVALADLESVLLAKSNRIIGQIKTFNMRKTSGLKRQHHATRSATCIQNGRVKGQLHILGQGL
jgi:hypothetical protein